MPLNRRLWLFRLTALFIAAALIEGSALLLFPLITHRAFSPAALDRSRELLVDAVVTAPKPDPKAGFLAEDALHP
jgi:hypothetical protein